MKKEHSTWLGRGAWIWLFLVLALVVGIRIRLLDMPLERDEGEYAYAGQLILEGFPPYQLAYNMKMPGVYFAYAAILVVFGQTPAGIHAGLLVVHLLTLVFLGAIARLYCRPWGTVATVATFALMMLSPTCLGLMGHATHFVLLPALVGVFLLLREGRRGKAVCWWSGLCFGVAFLMKQPGLFFGLGGGLFLLAHEIRARPRGILGSLGRLSCYALGCLAPFLLVSLGLAWAGVFGRFWFWTIDYAREYGSLMSWSDGFANASAQLGSMVKVAPLIWVGALLGLIRVCGAGAMALERRLVLAGFLLFSFLSVCPGLYFRQHYFILFLPAVALLAGQAVSWGEERLAGSARSSFWGGGLVCTVIVASAFGVIAERAVYFSLSPREASRAIYGINPFPESLDIAEYLKDHTLPGDRIAVIGSEPQIYFYADRHSSTGHIYTYALMEPQPFARTMQDQMIREIEENPPAYTVLVNVPTSWLARPTSDPHLLNWFDQYRQKQMELVGLIQYTGSDKVETVWGPEAGKTELKSPYFVAVFKRFPPKK